MCRGSVVYVSCISVRLRPKKSRRRGVDYSADIPFEKRPAPGEISD